MEGSRPGVKVRRAGLCGVFEGSNGGRCGCHREEIRRLVLWTARSGVGASVSLGVQESGLASAPAPGSPGKLCCRPSRSLGVQLVCLVQGSGAYPVMRDQSSQHPYEKTEADRSALATGTQVAVVHLELCLCDDPSEARQR